jgi:hypothetical protein
MSEYSRACINIRARNARYSADEHAQTSMSEHGPRPAGAQTAQKQHAGLLELHAQPSAASIRLPEGHGTEGLCSVRRTYIPDTCAAPGTGNLEGS